MAKCACCGSPACKKFTTPFRIGVGPLVVDVAGCADCMNARGTSFEFDSPSPGRGRLRFRCVIHPHRVWEGVELEGETS